MWTAGVKIAIFHCIEQRYIENPKLDDIYSNAGQWSVPAQRGLDSTLLSSTTGNTQVVLLLEHGADLNVRGNLGGTPSWLGISRIGELLSGFGVESVVK